MTKTNLLYLSRQKGAIREPGTDYGQSGGSKSHRRLFAPETRGRAFVHLKDVDFAVMSKASISLPQRIVNKGLLLFCKDDRMKIQYENTVRRLYIDAEHSRQGQSCYLPGYIDNDRS